MNRSVLTLFTLIMLASSPLLADVMRHEFNQPRQQTSVASRDSAQHDMLSGTGEDSPLPDNAEQKSLDRLNLNYDPQNRDVSWQLVRRNGVKAQWVSAGVTQHSSVKREAYRGEIPAISGMIVTF